MTNTAIIEKANNEVSNNQLKAALETLKTIKGINTNDADYLNHFFTFEDREAKLNELVKPSDDYDAQHHLKTMDILRNEDKQFEEPGSFEPDNDISLYKDSGVYAINGIDVQKLVNNFEEKYAL